MRNTLLALGLFASVGLGSTLHAQDNLYPLELVDSTGNVFPKEENEFVAPTTKVFMKLPSDLPSGIYWTQVTDGAVTQLASTDGLDYRRWQVVNNAGVLSVTQLDTANGTKVLGSTPNGSDTIPLLPHTYAGDSCRLKMWLSDRVSGVEFFDFDGGSVRSFANYRVENETDIPQGQVDAQVFIDTNENGLFDLGESPLPGVKVTASWNGWDTSIELTSDANGKVRFTNLEYGFWTITVSESTGYKATTQTSFEIESGPCLGGEELEFGKGPISLKCDGHTRGYWKSKHGLKFVHEKGLVPTLNALPLVNYCGRRARIHNLCSYYFFMKHASSRRMANMLSVQFTAMWLNRAAGFVSGGCCVKLPNDAGTITIDMLLVRTVAALDAYLDPGKANPSRAELELLKNLLDDANNNRNWACGGDKEESVEKERCRKRFSFQSLWCKKKLRYVKKWRRCRR